MANLPRLGYPGKFSQRTKQKMLEEVSKNPRISSHSLQVVLVTVDGKMHESAIKNKLQKLDLHGRCAREETCVVYYKNQGKDYNLLLKTSIKTMCSGQTRLR